MSVSSGANQQHGEEGHPIRFFQGNQIILLVNEQEIDPKKFLDDDLFKINPENDNFNLLLEAFRAAKVNLNAEDIREIQRKARNILNEEILNRAFEAGNAQNIPLGEQTIVHLDFENTIDDDEVLIYLTYELELRRLIFALERESGSREGNSSIEAISLNWWWSSSPDGVTSGGPGALPVRPSQELINSGPNFNVWDELFKPDIISRGRSNSDVEPWLSGGDCKYHVDVYILDTIPKNMQSAEFHNALLDEVNQKLSGNIHPYPINPIVKFEDHPVFIEGHPYDMSDHGLFIAGIVHQIARDENIHLHLIEVLDEFGVGTSTSLIWGLNQTWQSCQNNPNFIINTSLAITFSCHDNQEDSSEDERGVRTLLCALQEVELFFNKGWGTQAFLNNVAPTLTEGLVSADSLNNFSTTSTVKSAFSRITSSFPEVICVAAAGNDHLAEDDIAEDPPPSTTQARFPAAYDDVVGVGALTRNGRIARYSNKPDRPERDGFYAFGGDVLIKNLHNKWLASPKDGILSIFTQPTYPGDGTQNTTGWASWAGTSFASGVVTGVAANVICQVGLADKSAVIGILKKGAVEKNNNIGQVLPVGQGERGKNPGRGRGPS